MRPTVGRIVHYVSYGTPGGEYASECRAAVVTAVGSSDYEISLCVLNPTGLFFNHGVEEDQGEVEERPIPDTDLIQHVTKHRGGTWHWPERAEMIDLNRV